MSKKRKVRDDDYLTKRENENLISKKLKTIETELSDMINNVDKNDTQTSIKYLKNASPSPLYQLPQLFYLNQLYSLVKNKTRVDRDIEDLKNESKILMFKCDSVADQNDICVCETNDFIDYVKRLAANETNMFKSNSIDKKRFDYVLDHFLTNILCENKSLSIESSLLKIKFKFSDKDITQLVQFGLIIIKDSSNFWLAIPCIGQFRKDMMDARKCLLTTIRKNKVTPKFYLFF